MKAGLHGFKKVEIRVQGGAVSPLWAVRGYRTWAGRQSHIRLGAFLAFGLCRWTY